MLRFAVPTATTFSVGQESVWPMVYLDHCAWRTIADDPALLDRLVTTIHQRNGTLAVSWLNLVEFSQVADDAQLTRAECLLDRMLPNVFFLDSNPFSVTKRHRAYRAGSSQPPHGDDEFLGQFVDEQGTSLRLVTARGVFAKIRKPSIVAMLKDLAASAAGNVAQLASQCAADPEFMKQVRRPRREAASAVLVLKELVRTYLIDGKSRFDEHDAIDLLHASVPIAFCDFVVLDGEWKHRSGQIAARLKEASGSHAPARVFSVARNDLSKFLDALASAIPGPEQFRHPVTP